MSETFTPRFETLVFGGEFHDQRQPALAGGLFNKRLRMYASGFFVTVNKSPDWSFWQLAMLTQRADHCQHQRDTGFHVICAGADQLVALDMNGACRQRTERPD